eukprot:CAMPEP_0185295634 /NCGR_PEP_ID=MMETSP1363-20130426/8497_1 /TAXON_ID=38817 /ORGANISM="Gephyrocapsa oceanica, Strain RCC1303" /LENGTH=246 /DNA_ID=CAMNT_0027892205 /DNA_START=389 /DNA_END=1126 /DNA_ORIENTATION=+
MRPPAQRTALGAPGSSATSWRRSPPADDLALPPAQRHQRLLVVLVRGAELAAAAVEGGRAVHPAVRGECGVHRLVLHEQPRVLPRDREPLRALAPGARGHRGGGRRGARHARVVPVLHVVEAVEEGAVGAQQVVTHVPRSAQGHAALAQEHEALVRGVRQRGGEQAPLGVHHAHLAPLHLHAGDLPPVECGRRRRVWCVRKAGGGVEVHRVPLRARGLEEALPERVVRHRPTREEEVRHPRLCVHT